MTTADEIDAGLQVFRIGMRVSLTIYARVMLVQRVVSFAASDATGHEWGVHCAWHDDVGRPCSAVYMPATLNVTP